MLVLIRGAGDIASGVAVRLRNAGFDVAMTETAAPTTIRRAVAFSEAVRLGTARVEGISAGLARDASHAKELISSGQVAVLVDPCAECRKTLLPDALVDAILAKRNTGTSMADAPVVVGMGPGFRAGFDCHAAIETLRGHDLGRVLYDGSPVPDTGTPGEIAGEAARRVLRAPARGIFVPLARIGDKVNAGDTVATVDGKPMKTELSGVLRGLLAAGISVHEGMKSGDVDPRGNVASCFTVSDKARALGGAVLEAVMHFYPPKKL